MSATPTLKDVAHEVNDDLYTVRSLLTGLQGVLRKEGAPGGSDMDRIARVAIEKIGQVQDKLAPYV